MSLIFSTIALICLVIYPVFIVKFLKLLNDKKSDPNTQTIAVVGLVCSQIILVLFCLSSAAVFISFVGSQ